MGAEENVNEFLAAHNVEFPMAKGYGMTEVSSAATARCRLHHQARQCRYPPGGHHRLCV